MRSMRGTGREKRLAETPAKTASLQKAEKGALVTNVMREAVDGLPIQGFAGRE